jgi:hypothetical protein
VERKDWLRGMAPAADDGQEDGQYDEVHTAVRSYQLDGALMFCDRSGN